jgi:hypothetical protein
MAVVPARGLKRFRVSSFQGVELGRGVDLPIAWIRKKPRPKWRRNGETIEPSSDSWPLRAWVALTGVEVRHAHGVRRTESDFHDAHVTGEKGCDAVRTVFSREQTSLLDHEHRRG